MNKTWKQIKEEVNIADFATDVYGYEINKKKSSISWKLLEKDDDKIIVTKKNGHYLYFNPENDLDKGSIIDFVLYREKDYKIKDVYNKIINYLGENRQNERHITIPNRTESKKINIENFWKSYTGANKKINLAFFEKRGISKETVLSKKFEGKIFSAEYEFDGKKFLNTLFPLKNQHQIIGFDVRNLKYKGTIGLKKGAFWMSNYDKTKPVQIIMTDSPLDAIAHYELYGKEAEEKQGKNILYMASAGTLQLNQIKTLNAIINQKDFKLDKISFGFDLKPTDQRFTTRALGNIKLPGEEQKNKLLSYATVTPVFVNKEDNYIEIKVNTKTEKEAAAVLQYFEKLLDKYNKEQKRFTGEETTYSLKSEVLKDNSLNLQIDFKNYLGNWITVNEMIKEFKFANSRKIEFLFPSGKDFNEELQMIKKEEKEHKTDKTLGL